MLPFSKKNDVDFFNLLIQSAENTLKGAQLFRSAMMGDRPPATYYEQLRELEHKGDSITHQIYKGLNLVFMTPLDREDILEMAVKVDDVMDGMEATIARFDYMQIGFSNGVMKQFSEVLVESCDHILQAFKLLSKKKYLQIREHTIQINSLENEGDRLMREGIREIFSNPKDPYHDFKLKEIYERLEQTTDACEDVADILASVVLKYA
ncbi:DUF47 domain-containing protein [Paenibacillus thermoaerophilus]|uniref:DUF47 domain-containing protein n=1 Tax=Paenibacillus thermoaerophilus TaxID=1215385 RepID=A0ABW2V5J1_9BACL|nr:DUF47 family protein [Paenibacillus thermoaerophilus]TMV18669.1 DUF47 domain-containing protein [Paenibacillus thermoaerophilus]